MTVASNLNQNLLRHSVSCEVRNSIKQNIFLRRKSHPLRYEQRLLDPFQQQSMKACVAGIAERFHQSRTMEVNCAEA